MADREIRDGRGVPHCEQRLKNEAEASDMALMRLRKRVAFERFLARLAASEPSGWVLKGAFALELRLGLRARATKDIDLGRADDEEAATEHLNAATRIDLGDFFDFEVRRAPVLDPAAGFHAVRHTVSADLAGRRFEQFQPTSRSANRRRSRRSHFSPRIRWSSLASQRCSCRSFRSSSTLPRSSTLIPTPLGTMSGSVGARARRYRRPQQGRS
jgi:Nucleotidyl transferase AbiEii toxin, Type IV TA system